MKKVLYISFIVILVLSLCPIMSYATFDSDVWADSDAVLEKYNQTKYSTSYQEEDDIPCQTFWLSDEEAYIAQRIDLKEPADIISFGCGGTGKLTISVYEYDNCVADSVENAAIDTKEVDVKHSGWRTCIELKETIPAGSYVIKLTTTTPAQFWIAVSPYLEEMKPETNEIEYDTEIDSAADVVSCSVSFSTYLSKNAKLMFLENTTFTAGEDVTVSASGSEKDWVGLYKKGENPDAENGGVASIYWAYVSDFKGGSLALNNASNNLSTRPDGADFANGLPVGEYTINLFAEDSYNVIKSIDITVSAKTPAPTKSPATETPSASATPTATSAGNTNSYASDKVADKNASDDSSNTGLIASIIAVSVAVIVLVAAIVFAVKKSKKD